jgi:hypothetical protein
VSTSGVRESWKVIFLGGCRIMIEISSLPLFSSGDIQRTELKVSKGIYIARDLRPNNHLTT